MPDTRRGSVEEYRSRQLQTSKLILEDALGVAGKNKTRGHRRQDTKTHWPGNSRARLVGGAESDTYIVVI
jgi:hypothetical protein